MSVCVCMCFSKPLWLAVCVCVLVQLLRAHKSTYMYMYIMVSFSPFYSFFFHYIPFLLSRMLVCYTHFTVLHVYYTVCVMCATSRLLKLRPWLRFSETTPTCAARSQSPKFNTSSTASRRGVTSRSYNSSRRWSRVQAKVNRGRGSRARESRTWSWLR